MEVKADGGQVDGRDEVVDDLEAQYDNWFALCDSSRRHGHATPHLVPQIAFC